MTETETEKKKKLKKGAKEFAAFITEIATVMQKHKVNHLLAVFQHNGAIRNTYIPLEDEQEIYCNISDGIDTWLRLQVCTPKK
jgi:intergrase/recombinase